MVIDSVVNDAALNLTENTLVTGSGIVFADVINVYNGVVIQNDGLIATDKINIPENSVVYIENSGQINAEFSFGNNSHVVQLVKSGDDLTRLGVTGNFDVQIDSATGIQIGRLASVADGAGNLIIKDSELLIGGVNGYMLPDLSGTSVYVIGDVIVRAESVSDLINGPIFSGINGDGDVYVYANDISSLYAIQAFVENNKLYAKLVRETDYVKVLGHNRTGAFLNSLRERGNDKKLFDMLDAATTMNELQSVMARSVRLNPARMMRPVRVLNDFELINYSMDINNVVFRPSVIFTDDFLSYGININTNVRIGKNSLIGLSFSGSEIKYSDDINNFKSYVYGGNVHMHHFHDSLFFRVLGGVKIAMFDSGPVLHDDEITENPRGFLGYGITDIGIKFLLSDSVGISPFVRAGAEYTTMLDTYDIEPIASVGADVAFIVSGATIDYNYAVRFISEFNGAFGMTLRMNAQSVADNAGITVDTGLVYSPDFGYGLSVRLGGGFSF